MYSLEREAEHEIEDSTFEVLQQKFVRLPDRLTCRNVGADDRTASVDNGGDQRLLDEKAEGVGQEQYSLKNVNDNSSKQFSSQGEVHLIPNDSPPLPAGVKMGMLLQPLYLVDSDLSNTQSFNRLNKTIRNCGQSSSVVQRICYGSSKEQTTEMLKLRKRQFYAENLNIQQLSLLSDFQLYQSSWTSNRPKKVIVLKSRKHEMKQTHCNQSQSTNLMQRPCIDLGRHLGSINGCSSKTESIQPLRSKFLNMTLKSSPKKRKLNTSLLMTPKKPKHQSIEGKIKGQVTEGTELHNQTTKSSNKKQGIRLFSRSKERQNQSSTKSFALLTDRLIMNESASTCALTCCPSSTKIISAQPTELMCNPKAERTKQGKKIKPVNKLLYKPSKPIRLCLKKDKIHIWC